MADSRDSLKELLHGGKAKAKSEELAPDPAEETDELAFDQMRGDYSKLRPANKSLTRLHAIHSDGKVETLYHHLDAKSEFNGGSFTFLFSGASSGS